MAIKHKRTGPRPAGQPMPAAVPARSEIMDEDKQTIHRLRAELRKGKSLLRDLARVFRFDRQHREQIEAFLGGPEH